MRKLMNLILGMVVVKLTGPFPERLINLCAQEGIDFWAMEWLDEHTVRPTTRRRALGRLGELASRAGCVAERESSRGLPDFLGRHLPLVIGVLSVPLALAFDTDSYFYGMLPVMIGIGEGFGIAALPIAVAMVVCRNCATFISPMVPATLLGVGLADVDIKDHIKNSFLYVWGFSILCMIFAVLLGIMPL